MALSFHVCEDFYKNMFKVFSFISILDIKSGQIERNNAFFKILSKHFEVVSCSLRGIRKMSLEINQVKNLMEMMKNVFPSLLQILRELIEQFSDELTNPEVKRFNKRIENHQFMNLQMKLPEF